MIKNYKNKGFSLLEILISVAIFSVILLALYSFFLAMNLSNSKIKTSGEASENAKRVLDEITYEIRSAKSVYAPTTTANQLSLKTSRYTSGGQSDTFIDFFLCGSAVCLKKESQDPVVLTSDSVKVTKLEFSQISTDDNPSVKVSLTVNSGSQIGSSSTTLTSTASLRSY